MMKGIDDLSKFTGVELKCDAIKMPSIPDLSCLYNITPKIPAVEIDEESTFAYQMQQQTNQIIEKSNEQIELLKKQNEQIFNNYNKLEDMYYLKENELKEAKAEEKKSKRYNAIMLILTIISMLVAIASWLLPNILGGNS